MIRRSDTPLETRGADWPIRAITAGFFATVVTTIVLFAAYWLALAIGSPNAQAPILARWAWALANNLVTRDVQTALPLAILLHFLAGIAWAIVYAAVAERMLSGPGWRKGLLFSLVPWLLSLIVFLPAVGAGFLGLGLGAGPLPIVGNLILHLVYGTTLGLLYGPAADRVLSERGELVSFDELSSLAHSNRTMAAGIVLGLVIGALAGAVIGVAVAPQLGLLVTVLFGALIGSALGLLIGSFWGLSPQQQ